MEVLNKYYNTTLARVDMHPNKKKCYGKYVGFPIELCENDTNPILGLRCHAITKIIGKPFSE